VNRSKVGSDSDEMLEIFISRMEVVRQFTRSGLVHGGRRCQLDYPVLVLFNFSIQDTRISLKVLKRLIYKLLLNRYNKKE